MTRTQSIFKGYTVDLQLQEFRKIESGNLPEFIPLLSDKGASLFNEFKQTQAGQKELDYYWGRK